MISELYQIDTLGDENYDACSIQMRSVSTVSYGHMCPSRHLDRNQMMRSPPQEALGKILLSVKEEGSPTSCHLNQFFDIFEILTEIEMKLQDKLQATFMSLSLPKMYDNFIVAIEPRDDLPKISAVLAEGRRC